MIGNSNFSTRTKGYKNIFSTRSLAPGKPGGPPLEMDPFSGLTSPKGNMMRQEAYLKKITSEKRNIVAMKRFSNSGFGQSGYPYFVRKVA